MAKRKGGTTPGQHTARGGRDPGTGLSRREFLAGLAATTGALALGGCGEDTVTAGGAGQTDPELAPLPPPEESGIEHVVVVMMENRSFDHFLGWVPGADGKQAGVEFVDKQGEKQRSFPLAPDFQNCRFEDPDHGYRGGRTQFNGGANDGWLVAGTDDVFPIGYYTGGDLSFYGGVVPAFTTFDRYFCSILGPTFPNRIYMHSGQTDRITNTIDTIALPTIWDRLADKGLTGTYYWSDLPVLALWRSRYTRISKGIEAFFTDAAAGTLANVSYLDPKFIGEEQGITNDDHPLADIRNGQLFLNRIYEAVTSSPNWANTVLIINYDEWGGFYDHVPPPLAPKTDLDDTIGNDGRLGFRVPCVMISPLARRGFVGHQQYDHTSILNFIEWRWGLDALTVRDATANNIGRALDFTRPKDLTAPRFTVPQGPFNGPCPAQRALRAKAEFYELYDVARRDWF